MDSNKIAMLLSVLFVLILMATVMGAKSGTAQENRRWEIKTAQTECARYHPDTGEFEWIKETLNE